MLKSVHEQAQQVAFCREAVMKNYSVHALETLIKQHKLAEVAEAAAALSEKPKREVAEKTAHVKGLEDDLRQRLAVKIEIKVKAKDKGQIVIGFDSNDDFERIVQALQK